MPTSTARRKVSAAKLARYVELKEQVASLSAEMDRLNAEIKDALPFEEGARSRTEDIGGFHVVITGKRGNLKLNDFVEAFPVTVPRNRKFYVRVPSIKAILELPKAEELYFGSNKELRVTAEK